MFAWFYSYSINKNAIFNNQKKKKKEKKKGTGKNTSSLFVGQTSGEKRITLAQKKEMTLCNIEKGKKRKEPHDNTEITFRKLLRGCLRITS